MLFSKKTFFLIVLSTAVSFSAFAIQPFDLNQLQREDQIQSQPVKIVNSGFEENTTGWKGLAQAGKVVLGAGRNGTCALQIIRTDPKSYRVTGQSFKIEPSKIYEISAWVKTKDLVPCKNAGASLCLEFSGQDKNGKSVYLSNTGVFLRGIWGTKDWTLIRAEQVAPKNAVSASLSLYLWRGATGTAWFDDVSIKELGSGLWSVYFVAPYNTVNNGKLTVKAFYDYSFPKNKNLYIQLALQDGKTFVSKLTGSSASFDCSDIPDGTYNTKVYCIDAVAKQVVYSTDIPLVIQHGQSKQMVRFDARGRAYVDGELFMPLGVYAGNLTKRDIDAFSAAGVNCVLSYNSMDLRFREGSDRIELIREVLNYCAKKNVKVIFSAKDVGSKGRWSRKQWEGAVGQDAIVRKLATSFKDHSALLAWYINDEEPPGEIKRLTQMRRLFNQLDSNHPTYGIDYRAETIPALGSTADILGVDCYPVSKTKPYHLKAAEFAVTQLAHTSMPMWVNPQVMNMGTYYAKNDADMANFRAPNNDEMRSMALIAAIHGAKGFVYYNYAYLGSPKLPKESYAVQWKEFSKTVKALKNFQSFILSDTAPKQLVVDTLSGTVRVAEFTANSGEKAIVIVGVGPEVSKAMLKGEGDYRSAFGKTLKADGKYIFSGEGICSDILYLNSAHK